MIIQWYNKTTKEQKMVFFIRLAVLVVIGYGTGFCLTYFSFKNSRVLFGKHIQAEIDINAGEVSISHII